MNRLRHISVNYHQLKIGTLAIYDRKLAAFEYSPDWIRSGFSISPFSLPLKAGVYIPKFDPFDGLYGVFSDSLPDGWGRLVLDRMLLKQHIDPRSLNVIERLSIVGEMGLGALTYQPENRLSTMKDDLDLDFLAKESMKLLMSKDVEDLDMLFRLGGSSGGARPKVMGKIEGDEWIIKFPSSIDQENVGEMEYAYALCAKEAGIEMAEVRLFSSRSGSGYFGSKRFDRKKDELGISRSIHMISVSGLLETSHRIPNLDYHMLMKLTLELTRDMREVEKLYKLMCFNVYAHNRDDHSKNFSFLYDDIDNRWVLSPAYDLTYSYSIGGEHATTVNGNGMNPGLEDLLEVGRQIGIKSSEGKRIAEEIKEVILQFDLDKYRT